MAEQPSLSEQSPSTTSGVVRKYEQLALRDKERERQERQQQQDQELPDQQGQIDPEVLPDAEIDKPQLLLRRLTLGPASATPTRHGEIASSCQPLSFAAVWRALPRRRRGLLYWTAC